MTRRQDSQQHKMNKLQSSSGLGEFPYAAAFRREPARALGRRHPEASCASRVKIAWSATTLLAVRRPPPHRPPPSGNPSTLRSFALQPWAPLHRVATPYIREVRARCRCTGSVEE